MATPKETTQDVIGDYPLSQLQTLRSHHLVTGVVSYVVYLPHPILIPLLYDVDTLTLCREMLTTVFRTSVQVWGPQVQLTYWALQQYPHVPVVVKARRALAKQMTAMGVK